MHNENDPGVLNDIEQEIYMEPVSQGVRLANYLVDSIITYTLFFGVVAVWTAILQLLGTPYEDIFLTRETIPAKLLQMVVGFCIVLIYYTTFETATRGRTIGKLITASIAVKEDGTPLTFKEAFMRSLCRLIPFNVFSGLGTRPWHDSLSKTVVIKKTW